MAGLFPSPALDFGIWGRNLDETLTTVKTGKSIHYFPCQHRYCFLLSTSSNKKVLGIVCMPHSSVMNQGGDGEWKPPLPGASGKEDIVCRGSPNSDQSPFANVDQKTYSSPSGWTPRTRASPLPPRTGPKEPVFINGCDNVVPGSCCSGSLTVSV